MQISFEDRGVLAMLKHAPRQIARANRAAVRDIASIASRDLKTYPSPPARSTYRRTRTLGRSWQQKIEARGAIVRAVISSSGQMAPYNRWVQDERRQARHMRHWRNTLQATGRRHQKTGQAIWRKRLQAEVGK